MNQEHFLFEFHDANSEKDFILEVKNSDTEFTNYCRACLKKTKDMIFLLESTETTNEILNKYCNILNLQVELKNDNDPSYICKICLEKINNFYDFKQQCLASNDLIFHYQEALAQEKENSQYKDEETSFDFEDHQEQTIYISIKQENNDVDGLEDPLSQTNNQKRNLKLRKLRLAQYDSEEVNVAINTVREKLYKHTTCIFCSYNAGSNRSLSIHVSKIHSEHKNHWCSTCNQLIENLSLHNKEIHKEDLKCQFCSKIFSNIGHFMEHMASHAGTRDHKCKICNLLFTSSSNLKVHLEKHENKPLGKKTDLRKLRLTQYSWEEINKAIKEIKEKLYKHTTCIFCSFNAGSNKSLSVHVTRTHSEYKSQWCCTCNQLCDDLAVHTQEIHSEDLKCKFCNKIIKGLGHLMEHMASHAGTRNHKCRLCNQLFTSSRNLKTHIEKNCKRSVDGIKNEKLEEDFIVEPQNYCQICNKKVRSLQQHNDTVHSDTTKLTQECLCTYCGKQFGSLSKLNFHVRVHTGETPYKCKYCDKKLRTRNVLVSHERTHTKEKPFICNICGKAFSQSSCLKTHSKIHLGKSEQCTICKKRFCRPAELKLHMRKHTGEKPYICDECGRSFVQRSHLVEHKRRHLDDRPFKCDNCEKAFKDLSTLKSHLQIHSGDKPFKCSQCSYACRQPYSLTQHMQQHDEDRPQIDNPHVCEICQKSFLTTAHLSAHFNRYHTNLKRIIKKPMKEATDVKLAHLVDESQNIVDNSPGIPVVVIDNSNVIVDKFDNVFEYSV